MYSITFHVYSLNIALANSQMKTVTKTLYLQTPVQIHCFDNSRFPAHVFSSVILREIARLEAHCFYPPAFNKDLNIHIMYPVSEPAFLAAPPLQDTGEWATGQEDQAFLAALSTIAMGTNVFSNLVAYWVCFLANWHFSFHKANHR